MGTTNCGDLWWLCGPAFNLTSPAFWVVSLLSSAFWFWMGRRSG